MPIHYLLESFGWILYLVNHRVSDIADLDYIGVGLIFPLPLNCALLWVKSGFIEVQIFAHRYALSRNKKLQ